MPVIEKVGRIDALREELVRELGERGVSTDDRARSRASRDGSYLSPIIQAQLPLGLADIVAYPRTIDQVARTVAAAVRLGVPITPRGKGTANYGQTLPLHDGLVLDLSHLRETLEIADGLATADAGATMFALERAANAAGQQLLMYPSTVGSTLGGFLAGGSGGTGSVVHGPLMQGFVTALDIVPGTSQPQILHVEGTDTEPYLHNYGTGGIIVRATVRLEPLQAWRACYAAFPGLADALTTIRPLMELSPGARLISADHPELAAALPPDPALEPGSASLRAILDERSLPRAREIIAGAGGHLTAVREEPAETFKMSMISYNHPIQWLQKAHPDTYFHVEVSGWNLIDRLDEVEAVYPAGRLHLEAQQGRPIGMLAGRFRSDDEVIAGFDKLTALGVGFHNPHQWFVDYEPERARELAGRTDPHGLLNPGKLVEPTVVTGSRITPFEQGELR